MLKKFTIKKKILLLILIITSVSVISYTILSIYITKKIENNLIDTALVCVALGAKNIIGDPFHDAIIDSSSVSQEEYNKIVAALSEYAHETNVKEIYSYINYHGELRFTAASLKYEDYKQGKIDTFFTKYYDDPKFVQSVYFKPFREKKPTSNTYEDASGAVRSSFLPFLTKSGKSYIIAVDYSSAIINDFFTLTTNIYLVLGLVILTLACFLALRPINQISKPLKNLVLYTTELVHNDFNLPEKSMQNLTDFSSNSTFEVRQLSEAFLMMQFSLKQYIIDLRNTTIAKESMEGQLRIARSIQMSMIPKDYTTFPDQNKFCIYGHMTPAKEVGGDLFNYFMIDDDHLAFAIGDVSDKGIPAALFMAMTNTLIKAIALSGLSPAEILFKANNELCKENDQCMFVTLVLGILNINSGQVEYANAGHNPFIVIKNNNVVEYREVVPGMVLAAFEDVIFVNEHLKLNPEETIFMYTDGVTEARNSIQEFFGEKRLLELIKGSGSLTTPDLIDETMKGVAQFVNGHEQSDDITILALRFRSQQNLV
jgi:phosphoserine phosphatase RsbU/P